MVRHVDPFSVLKISLLFYAALLIVWLLIVAIFYNILKSLGLFEAIDAVRESFVLGEGAEITLGLVERWALLVGVTFTVVMSLINTFFAVLYNVIADAIGGIELTFIERDL